MRKLGQHPSHTISSSTDHNRVEATLDVSVLFGHNQCNVKAAVDFVVHGVVRPASAIILSRLCLSTEAAMKQLGVCPRSRYAFCDVIRCHLECLGPRTGLWNRRSPGSRAGCK